MIKKNVFITGVHTGLGHALAARCLARGDAVWGVSRQVPPDIGDHPSFTFQEQDLSQIDRIPDSLEHLLAERPPLDLVVLNAGVLGPLGELPKTPVEELNRVFQINVSANKAILDHLVQRSPRPVQVIGISSGAAKNGSAGWGAYSISKAALNILLKVYANENPDTHFTALAPGLVQTPMMDGILARAPNPEWDADTRLRAASKEGRINAPADVAASILDIADQLKTVPSGEFVDIRALPWKV